MFFFCNKNLLKYMRRSFITLNGVLYAKRTWQTNMKRKTYRSKKRKKYIRLGETLIRIQ
ncbi:hypothetical protein PFAG_03081 [Plasmodium falciparum Santa Lucia]|uniref:Uncharacterized protein n=11 Tax=Plasmodium (Laverania) TaxID=418107 RepID=C6S3E4_PLAF7|nr:conserved Plasmodium protein, unknown function [Plasmodium falciparum 3D7]ETW18017.1 hypothetical protein PFFVO_03088 [Plasmodium falciparum Vietnam Oak-Knoll (FVO)]ETW36157.1 hypothetical protein PFTANZ_03146 [Plasmodium falciparum Tanzania (2000708)]ETW42576.1 hypothetical protein PFNF135_03235 [Plasmodium falciparum NF135/5.C10]ETW48943.1 hypothetical protein PFMALIP_03081 [Plasmodium falciparum MaliPS096_E11]ETW61206.1 hypothetical protein PFMC_03070 [Plasmodium falciparum CAMP/Malaysia|eukprot:XP_002585421.1 conserved Plasmodium protein, unknown function [Plasmodium falciparum 3D7]